MAERTNINAGWVDIPTEAGPSVIRDRKFRDSVIPKFTFEIKKLFSGFLGHTVFTLCGLHLSVCNPTLDIHIGRFDDCYRYVKLRDGQVLCFKFSFIKWRNRGEV